MRMYIKSAPTVDVSPYNDNYELPSSTVVYEPTPYQSLLVDTSRDVNGNEVIFFCSDVSLLLNQRRIDESMLPALRDLMQGAPASVTDYFDGMSDDELLRSIKSRYIQAPSEVQSYMLYLQSEIEAGNLPADPPADLPADSSAGTLADTVTT